MRDSSRVCGLIATVALAIAILSLRGLAEAGECEAPKYKIGPFDTGRGAESRTMTLAISPQDFTRERLRCLVSVLKEKYSEQKALGVMVFDSRASLSRYSGSGGDDVDGTRQASVSHLHAIYYVDAKREYLELKPIGTDGTGPFDSRMDLRSDRSTDCRVIIRNRCLMALASLTTHTVTVLEAPVEVSVRGQLLPDGRLTHLETTDRDLSGARRDFARWAVQTLKTWRFERVANRETVNVTVTVAVSPTRSINDMSVETNDPGSTIDIQVTVGVQSMRQ